MNLKITQTNQRLTDLDIYKDNVYEVEEIIVDSYKIKVPMKQKGKFRYALVKDDEGELVN